MVKKERHAILQAQTVSTCFNMIRHAKWSTPSTGFSQLAAVLLKFTSRMTLMAPSRCTSSCRSKRWAGRFLLLAVGSLWGCRCFANLWEELFHSPAQWLDFRVEKAQGKRNPRFPDFKRTEDGEALWINARNTPAWVEEKLSEAGKLWKSDHKSGGILSSSYTEALWQDLIASPTGWQDFRATKTVPRFPDFKRKGDGRGLWLDSPNTPDWVAERLMDIEDQLVPEVKNVKKSTRSSTSSPSVSSKEGLWQDLIASPTRWQDFRSDKPSPKFPDFKRIEDGTSLWVDSPNTPDWVAERLMDIEDQLVPGVKSSKEGLWQDLIASPTRWQDFRSDKPSPKFPDFKRIGDGLSLWFDSYVTPDWVAERLMDIEDQLVPGVKNVKKSTRSSTSSPSVSSKEGLWQDLIASPTGWQDFRSDKPSPKFPDFKRIEDGTSLWFDSYGTPDWVAERLMDIEDQLVPGQEATSGSSAKKSSQWRHLFDKPEWATEELVKIEDKLEVGQPARQHLSSQGQGEEAVWRDLINSHQDWYDFRAFKPFPGFPDFKRKGDGRGLWLDRPDTPEWAAEELVKIEDKLEVGRPAWQHIRSCN